MAIESLSSIELQKVLDRLGSYKAFRETFGLSNAELDDVVREHKLTLKKLSDRDGQWLESELKRIGSVELLAMIHDCKISEIRRRALETGVNIKLFTAPFGSTIGRGRIGETYFAFVRGEDIVEDCFRTKGHSAPFDFRDTAYGLVNVKTASRQIYKSKVRKNIAYWHFSTKGWKGCDWLALVPLNPEGHPTSIIMTEASKVCSEGKDHLILTSRDIARYTTCIDGPLYQLLDELFKLGHGIKPTQVQPVCEAIP